jgi:two-component system sensor histidine kinase VicK
VSERPNARTRRELALALEATEARYRQLVENAPDIIYRTDTHGHFTFVNRTAAVLIGRSEAELLGCSYLDLIHPDDRERMRRTYGLQWMRHQPTTYSEFRVDSRTRGIIWIGQNVRLLVEEGERLGFEAVARDVTDRKLAEHALEQLQKQTQFILDSAAEGILSVDASGCIVLANPAAAELTGFSQAEMQGQSAHALLHHARPDGSPYPEGECRIHVELRNGVSRRLQRDVFWRRDGSSFPVEYTAVPVRENGDLAGAVLTFHDISDRLTIERMRNEFIAAVSHELRTPVTSIRAAVEMVASGMLQQNTPQATRLLEVATGNIDRLSRLIEDIMDVQQLASGDLSLDRQRVAAQHVVDRSVAVVWARAAAANVDIAQHVEPVEIVADPLRLSQALTKLLDNAIKFSPDGSTIDLSVHPIDSEAQFDIRDRGPGIPASKVASIFKRFEAADTSDTRLTGGLGLGLSISRSIVELHGGRIWVTSTRGDGSTFSFVIPMAAQA